MTTFLPIGEWGGTPNGAGLMQIPVSEEWVHHSVTDPASDPRDSFRTLDAIGLARGHGGISYSYVIQDDVIGEGQGVHVGAHTAAGPGALDRNPWSFGVVFVGNFNIAVPSPAAIESYHWLRAKRIAEGHLLPGVYPTGGHRDAPGQSTACPGDNIEAILDVLREEDDMPTVDEIVQGVMAALDGQRPDYNAAGVANLRTLLNQLSGAFPADGVPNIAQVLAQLGAAGAGDGLSEDQVRAIVHEAVREELDATKLGH